MRTVHQRFGTQHGGNRSDDQHQDCPYSTAAVAAVAMQMLEEVERQRASAVEEIDITLFNVQKIAAAKLVDEIEKAAPLAGREKRGRADDLRDLRQSPTHVRRRIGQERAEGSEHKQDRLPQVSRWRMGVSLRRPILPPNSVE